MALTSSAVAAFDCTRTSKSSVSPALPKSLFGLKVILGNMPVPELTLRALGATLTRSRELSENVPSLLIPAYTKYDPSERVKVLVEVSQLNALLLFSRMVVIVPDTVPSLLLIMKLSSLPPEPKTSTSKLWIVR